jgi:hypothetical protein
MVMGGSETACNDEVGVRERKRQNARKRVGERGNGSKNERARAASSQQQTDRKQENKHASTRDTRHIEYNEKAKVRSAQ